MISKFLVVDCEATGPNPTHAELLTACFLYLDSDLDVIDRYDLKARPRKWDKLADESVEIHGISYAEALHFPPFKDSLTDFAEWLKAIDPAYFVCHANRTIFGSFSSYDYALLTSSLFDLNLHWVLYKSCPRRFIISTHSLAKYLNLPCDLNLKAVAEYLGVVLNSHHEARADTMACYEIFKKLWPQVDPEEFYDWEYKLDKEVLNDEKRKGYLPREAKRKSRKLSGNNS